MYRRQPDRRTFGVQPRASPLARTETSPFARTSHPPWTRSTSEPSLPRLATLQGHQVPAEPAASAVVDARFARKGLFAAAFLLLGVQLLRCPCTSRLAARGGRLHSPDDAQADRREADVRRRAAAFVGRRAAGLPTPGPVAAGSCLRAERSSDERRSGGRGSASCAPAGCSQGKAGAGMHHRRAPGVDGGDDLL